MTPAGTLIDEADAIALLRDLHPPRAMTWAEAHFVAARQAILLLHLMRIDGPPVPQYVISSLPGILVDRRRDWPTSGMAVQAQAHWQIVLRSSESRQRQRFSLAHEFKHVLDDPILHVSHRDVQEDRRDQRAERLCNFFAACLLMPRAWVERDWHGGMHDVRRLARRYDVSIEAMDRRLRELGLRTAGQRDAGKT